MLGLSGVEVQCEFECIRLLACFEGWRGGYRWGVVGSVGEVGMEQGWCEVEIREDLGRKNRREGGGCRVMVMFVAVVGDPGLYVDCGDAALGWVGGGRGRILFGSASSLPPFGSS